ncbi:DUF693 family protein [Borreliella burgdorferi]|uniref:DUF693 family protein n=2 Tax=Borreliella burgdorferi TaxID=139 RepID=UPI00016B3093|nr:DUF693 family protein [Borreliella burgdorferi]ACL34091.1 conserved hypothetical protein [Borreliella burgdorferi 156a]ACL34213.1 conserved hypothetical protein [Borreliella burgdorferi 156a]MCD2331732.1 DUF693 family protein [Borreliella burgdorferi]MCD2408946.1 DUF693 family protein [Borreliella burgdorferi]PRR04777.1 hypothetical protein CV664_05775 [Borreliella burgdorferi]
MLLLQYDFKIEFYNVDTSKKSIDGTPFPKKIPKITINTQDGIHVDISISNRFSSELNTVSSKQAKIVLWNLPLDFTEDIKEGDIVKIYYKKFAHEKNFDFIMAGTLEPPMSTDYPGGDFSVELEVRLLTKSNFFNRKLENKNFKGKTVQEAIESVFPNRNILNMDEKDRLKIINKNFYAATPKEFIEKIKKGNYVDNVITDVGYHNFEIECNFIFTNDRTIEADENYKALEDYGLEFIPQQESDIDPEFRIRRIYWNAQIFFTHKLRVGDKVSFRDGLGKVVKNTILETSARLSNTGDCSLTLKLYDASNFAPMPA